MKNAARGIASAWGRLSMGERLVAVVALVWPFRVLLLALLPIDLHLGAVSFLVLGVYALATVRRPPAGFPSVLDVAVMSFAVIAVADVLLLGDFERSIKGLSFEGRFVVFYFVSRSLMLGLPLAHWLLGHAVVLGIAAAIVGLVEYHSQWGWLLETVGLSSDSRYWKAGIPRLYSFAMVPLSAAYLEILTLCATIAAAIASFPSLVWGGTVVLLWQALPLTLSRSAVTVGIILTVGFAVAGGRIGRRFAVISLVAILAGGSVVVARGWDRAMVQHAKKTVTLSDTSAQWHGHAVESGLDLFLARPFGYGLGEAGWVARTRGGVYAWNETHYLSIAIQMGIPGVLSFLGILAASGWLWLVEARQTDRKRRAFGFAGLGLWAALSLGGLFHATWNMLVPQLWFWLLTAIAMNEQACRTEERA